MKHQRLARDYEQAIQTIKQQHSHYTKQVNSSARKTKSNNKTIILSDQLGPPDPKPRKKIKGKRSRVQKSLIKTQRNHNESSVDFEEILDHEIKLGPGSYNQTYELTKPSTPSLPWSKADKKTDHYNIRERRQLPGPGSYQTKFE